MLLRAPYQSETPVHCRRVQRTVRLAEGLFSSVLAAYHEECVDEALETIQPWHTMEWLGMCSRSALTETFPALMTPRLRPAYKYIVMRQGCPAKLRVRRPQQNGYYARNRERIIKQVQQYYRLNRDRILEAERDKYARAPWKRKKKLQARTRAWEAALSPARRRKMLDKRAATLRAKRAAMTPEQREKAKAKALAKYTPEKRAKQLARERAKRASMTSEEKKENYQKQKAKETPEQREKRTARNRVPKSQAQRDSINANQKARRQRKAASMTAEEKAELKAEQKAKDTPEKREKRNTALNAKRASKTPEEKERHKAKMNARTAARSSEQRDRDNERSRVWRQNQKAKQPGH